MKVLVAWASRCGSTRGIAEFLGEKLRERGLEADVMDADAARDVEGYDAFVIGSALYMFHWMKEARKFVSRNKAVLSARPVWLFSSGPVGTRKTDKQGRDVLEVAGPRELDELRALANPREHRVFFGAVLQSIDK
jgi:menaquinone-dependent protoporphyrinogen oxidase